MKVIFETLSDLMLKEKLKNYVTCAESVSSAMITSLVGVDDSVSFSTKNIITGMLF